MEKKSFTLPALIIGLAVIISLVGSMYLFTDYKKSIGSSIQATGSAELDLESDLIVWRGSFSAQAESSKDAYDVIKKDAEQARKFLSDSGITDNEMVFESVNIGERTRPVYDNNGNYNGSEFVGYELSQNVIVTSKDIDKVEKVSRDISKLLEDGVQFTSHSPEYYCTTLSDSKLELIKLATKNAKERIDIMAAEANATVGKLRNSYLGVFQIVAKNSGTSSYSYDGYLDKSSRTKTASITVRLEYTIK